MLILIFKYELYYELDYEIRFDSIRFVARLDLLRVRVRVKFKLIEYSFM